MCEVGRGKTWGQSSISGEYKSTFLLQIEASGRPVSRILLYPAIHLRENLSRAPLRGAAPTSPEPEDSGTIWLARTGGLPGRPLTGYRRWALTPPFHPSPVPGRSEPSAGLLSVALDVTGGLRHPVPRVLSPSGLSGPEASGPRESGLFSAPRLCSGRSDGSDGPSLKRIIPPDRGRRGRSSWGSGVSRPCPPGSSSSASAGCPRPPGQTRPPGTPRDLRRARGPLRKSRSL